MLKSELMKRLNGTIGCLAIDGATLYGRKCIVVLWVSAELQEENLSIVLGVYEPTVVGAEVYNFEKMAADVRAWCEEFGIDIKVFFYFCFFFYLRH